MTPLHIIRKAVAPEAATLDAWKDRIANREAKVGIVGLGYVGLPLALLFSEERFAVTGFDVDSLKVDFLNKGKSYIHRIEAESIQAAQKNGFVATADFSEARYLDAILICVPTPIDDHSAPDMSYVVNTIEALAPHLHAGQLVVLESTTYPGTTEEIIAATIDRIGEETDVQVLRDRHSQEAEMPQELDGVMVAFSPEREDPGNTDVERHDIPKVIGGIDRRASEAAEVLYASIFRRTVRVSTPATAEMTKLLENIYRCVNIAMVNELKQLCMRMGIDIWEVIDAAATKPFGFQAFYPGPGIGGHCIPVDPFYLSWKAKEYHFSTRFIELAGEVNRSMPEHVIRSVVNALNDQGKSIKGAKVLMLGLAYKKDIDDLRESPSLPIYEMLEKKGAEVRYNDPYFPRVGSGRKYWLNTESAPLENLDQYDCVVIVTDHSAYDFEKIVAESRLVVDTRNATRGIRSPKIYHC
nr:nucleotide sugar dehydrogenase [Terriglobus albidus]